MQSGVVHPETTSCKRQQAACCTAPPLTAPDTAALQAYEFAFNPAAGIDALNQNMQPVSAGVKAVLPSSGNKTVDFDLLLSGCREQPDPVYASWPAMEPGTGYFAVFALVSQYGVLNPAYEGAVASTVS